VAKVKSTHDAVVDPVLVDSWELSLRAERKSPQTIKSYTTGVQRFVDFCALQGVLPRLDKDTANRWVASMLEDGAEASTARSRQLGLRRFTNWLSDEGELADDPLLPVLTEDQIKALLKACAGLDLRDLRDYAIVRLMVETGARAGEVVGLKVADVKLRENIAIVRRGKGGKGRTIPIGAKSVASIDAYMRKARRHHRLADSPDLWLGDRGKAFSYDALHKTLRMAVAGWSTRDMIDRYAAATAGERAAAEATRLNLGDL
jgi:integrase/recombinase XerD